jgi:ABC-2 type transport system permease protein
VAALEYLLLALLGLFFWNCAFAAIAVTINDPNSSTRSSLMFLPLMFVAMGFPGLQTPDARVMKALSVLPGTSPTVMTARLVLSDVAAWEVGMAIGLMILSILLLRRIGPINELARLIVCWCPVTGRESRIQRVERK